MSKTENLLVLQNAGPVGGPGMPEVGLLPIPEKLLKKGVRDLVRVSECRMSGIASGTIGLHVAPEAAVGGHLALVRTRDEIELDVDARRLQLMIDDEELERRRVRWEPHAPAERGYTRLYQEHVSQAERLRPQLLEEVRKT